MAPDLLAALVTRADSGRAIELRNSECRIRFARPDSPETASHSFGWYWPEWCPLLGVTPDEVLADLPTADFAETRMTAEIWAAAWLLGHDAAQIGQAQPRIDAVLRAALASWIDSGLCDTDLAALTSETRGALIDLAMSAFSYGEKS